MYLEFEEIEKRKTNTNWFQFQCDTFEMSTIS